MSFLKRIKSKTDSANARKEKVHTKEERKLARRVERYERTELRRAKCRIKYEADRGRNTCTFWCNKPETVAYFQERGFEVKAEPYIDSLFGKYKIEVEWD